MIANLLSCLVLKISYKNKMKSCTRKGLKTPHLTSKNQSLSELSKNKMTIFIESFFESLAADGIDHVIHRRETGVVLYHKLIFTATCYTGHLCSILA